MAMIRGDRARELLAAVSAARGPECAEQVAVVLSESVEFLLGDLIVARRVSVVDAKRSRAAERIRVRYQASRVGGSVEYYLGSGEPFLSYTWFVT